MKALTKNKLEKIAPAIFAENHTMSSRYAQVNTWDIIKGMRKKGYHPVSASQAKTKVFRTDEVHHMVVLRHDDYLGDNTKMERGEIIPQITLFNNHMGRNKLRLYSGMHRVICDNGLIRGDVDQYVEVRHTGDAVVEAQSFAEFITEGLTKSTEVVEDWKGVLLTPRKKNALAKKALELRFGAERAANYKAADVLANRRDQDVGNDLWRVFNTLQENLVQGGLEGVNPETKRRSKCGSLTQLAKLEAFGFGLWNLASEVAA